MKEKFIVRVNYASDNENNRRKKVTEAVIRIIEKELNKVQKP